MEYGYPIVPKSFFLADGQGRQVFCDSGVDLVAPGLPKYAQLGS